jgi:hypothetical protein
VCVCVCACARARARVVVVDVYGVTLLSLNCGHIVHDDEYGTAME